MMISRSGIALAAALLIFLAGCDSNDPSDNKSLERGLVVADAAYASLVADVGGIEALSNLRLVYSDEQFAAKLAEHGIAFEIIDTSVAEDSSAAKFMDVTQCLQFFPTSDRVKWFRLVGAGGPEDHYIDSRGRPATSFKALGPVVAAPRQTTCQTAVGNWGSPASSFDGGHMIGSQLGGWGGRANVVPQHFNFNRGNWLKVENALAKCGRLGTNAVEYHVDVDYPSTTALTPSQFHADVKIGGVWKSADFTNVSGGGPNGTASANAMVSWLQARGCT